MSPKASESSSPTPAVGLTSQVATATGLLRAFVADLEPDTLLGRDAADLHAAVAGWERLVGEAKLLLATARRCLTTE